MNYPASSLGVTKLKKGSTYDFRVFAENIHGDSEPLLTEGPTKAENPFCKLLDLTVPHILSHSTPVLLFTRTIESSIQSFLYNLLQ